MLGFTDYTTRIYIGGTTGWYFWDQESQSQKPITAPMLRCKLIGVNKIVYDGDHGSVSKLTVDVRTDNENYQICTGFQTWFSKTLLIQLAQLESYQFQHPIKIQPKPSKDNEKVVFCRLYVNEVSVSSPPWEKDNKGKVVVDTDAYYDLVCLKIKDALTAMTVEDKEEEEEIVDNIPF